MQLAVRNFVPDAAFIKVDVQVSSPPLKVGTVRKQVMYECRGHGGESWVLFARLLTDVVMRRSEEALRFNDSVGVPVLSVESCVESAAVGLVAATVQMLESLFAGRMRAV